MIWPERWTVSKAGIICETEWSGKESEERIDVFEK